MPPAPILNNTTFALDSLFYSQTFKSQSSSINSIISNCHMKTCTVHLLVVMHRNLSVLTLKVGWQKRQPACCNDSQKFIRGFCRNWKRYINPHFTYFTSLMRDCLNWSESRKIRRTKKIRCRGSTSSSELGAATLCWHQKRWVELQTCSLDSRLWRLTETGCLHKCTVGRLVSIVPLVETGWTSPSD